MVLVRQARVITVTLAALAVLWLVGVASAAASAAPEQPLVVASASLAQEGRSVIWKLGMERPFSPSRLARAHRTLCLAFERHSGAAFAELCVIGPRRGSRAPRLQYARLAGGAATGARVINATVARHSSRDLTASFLPGDAGLPYRPVRWQVLSTVAASACGQPVGAPPCADAFPHRSAVTRLHTPQLVGCVSAGADFVNHGPTNRHVIALTFDDGPWPDTPQFLSVLEREHVPATFFEIGNQISTWGQRGAIERRMLADGDMIGDHTWDHADVAGDGSFGASEITRTDAAIRAVTGFSACLFRAPYGAVSSALIAEARSLGFTTIQWDIDPRDWSRPGTSAIYGNVIGNAHNGAIVIQHDGGGDRSETLAALPVEIDALKRQGYRFVTITDLLGLRLIYK